MPKIKYSLELKLQVIKESLITKDLWKLSIKYNIISGPTLIRYWIKRYTNFNEQIGCMKEESTMKDPKKVQSNNYELFEEIKKLKLEKNQLEIELKKNQNEVKSIETKLTNKMNKMEKQNNKEIESKNLKIKFLEKSIPSLLKLEMKEIAKTKFFKHQVYCLIYENEATSVLSIRNMCKELNLHKSKYLEWKTRHELLTHKELQQLYIAKSIDGIWMPIFSTKEDLSATEMVDRYYLENNNLVSGSNRIRIWIKNTFNKSISNKLIRKIQKKDIARRPTCHRNKKSGSGTYTLQKYVREDLVLDNTITNRIGEIIGMDGTWFKELIINGVKTQILCEVAYDWFTRKMIAWEFSDSENSEVVLKTLIKAHIYLIDNSCSNSIIQMDRSSANASTKILDYENIQQDFVISMSKAGFKHNSVTESLNGWYKEQFYKTYDYEFKSITDFKNKFKEFVNIKNTSQSMFYNKINMNEKPQLSI